MFSNRSWSFGESWIRFAVGSTHSFPTGLWVLGSDAGDNYVEKLEVPLVFV